MILVVPSGGTLNFTVMLDVFSTGTGTLVTTITNPTSAFPSMVLTIKGQSGALTQRTLTLGTLLANATSVFAAGGICSIAPAGSFRIDFTTSGSIQEIWIKGVDTTNGWETDKVLWQQCDSASDYMGVNTITNQDKTNYTLAANQDVRNVLGGIAGTLNAATAAQVLSASQNVVLSSTQNNITSGTWMNLGTVSTLTNALSVPTAQQISDTVASSSQSASILAAALAGNSSTGAMRTLLEGASGSAAIMAAVLTLPSNASIATAVWNSTTDGVTYAKMIEVLAAVVMGKATVSGSTVTYKKRDGSTATASITFDSSGNRSASTIL